ncbi:hypothetical protein IVA82_42280 [Bradyrhizobium sp. 142]|nr:hypothetical protein [Bradyrhizobium sp. 142]
MSDIKLFRIANGAVNELAGTTDATEKSVQNFFEKNLEALLDDRFHETSPHGTERMLEASSFEIG